MTDCFAASSTFQRQRVPKVGGSRDLQPVDPCPTRETARHSRQLPPATCLFYFHPSADQKPQTTIIAIDASFYLSLSKHQQAPSPAQLTSASLILPWYPFCTAPIYCRPHRLSSSHLAGRIATAASILIDFVSTLYLSPRPILPHIPPCRKSSSLEFHTHAM